MKDMVFLDVAIGLVLMYLVISLICSAIKEWISQVLSWRAEMLEKAVYAMLGGVAPKKGATAPTDDTSKKVAEILDHPLIKIIEPGKNAKPSYIAAGHFAMALMDKLGIKGEDGKITSTLPDKLKDTEIGKILTPMLDMAAGDATAFVKGIESWFNSTMDRVSGWYTRKANIVLFLIGIIAAILCNADSAQVVARLSADHALAAQIAGYAETVAAKGEDKEAKGVATAISKSMSSKTVDLSIFGGLPVGWGSCMTGQDIASFSLANCYASSIGGLWGNIGWFFVKLVGLGVTGLMVSLGAPFWFGLLQQFGAIRATGPKPPAMSTPPT